MGESQCSKVYSQIRWASLLHSSGLAKVGSMALQAPKQWCLTKIETVESFESLKQNLLYILSLYSEFAPFLLDGVLWKKKSKNSPCRGFVDDVDTIPLYPADTQR